MGFCPLLLHQIAFHRFAFLNSITKSLNIVEAAKTLFACLVVSREGSRDQRSSIAYLTSRKRGLFAMRKIN